MTSAVPRARGSRPVEALQSALASRHAPLIAVPLLAAVVAFSWFQSGHFFATGDVGPFIRDGLAAEFPWPWNHQVSGGGSLTYQVVRLPELVLLGAADLVGWSESVAQRLFLSTLFGLCGLAVALFARAVGARSWAIAAAGLVGAFNPYVLIRLPNPLPLVAIILAASLGCLVVRAARGDRPSVVAFAVGSVAASYLALNPPLLVAVVLWLATLAGLGGVWGGVGGAKRAIIYLLRCAPLALVLSLWWTVPYAMSLIGSDGAEIVAERDVQSWAWSHRRNSLGNLLTLKSVWGWREEAYYPYSATMDRLPFGALAAALPLLALSAPIVALRARRRTAIGLAALVAVLVLLSKGLHAPFAAVNLWLYDHVPGFWLFREPESKFGVLTVVLYGGLVGIALTAAIDRLSAVRASYRRAGLAFAAAVTLAAAIHPYPLWTGDVIPGERPERPSAHVSVPEGWRRAADVVNGDAAGGKALVLPLNDYYQMPTTWGFYGSDTTARGLLTRSVLSRSPGGYFASTDALDALVSGVEEAFVTGDVENVPALLRALGVSHLLLRRDLEVQPGRTFADPDVIAHGIERLPDLRRLGAFDVVDVYRFDRGALAYAAEPSVFVQAGDAAAMTAAVAAGGDRGVVVAEGSTGAEAATDPAVVASTGDLELPEVPMSGTYDIVRSLRGDMVYELRDVVVDGRRTLELRDPETLELAGREMARRPSLRVPVVAGATSVRFGQQLVRLPLEATSRTFVRIGGATSVEQYGDPTPTASVLGSFGEVGDCHRFDDRPTDELRLRSRRVRTTDGLALELRARAHSACVVAEVGEGGNFDGRPLVVMFEHRTLRGRAARTCLWQHGRESCARIPPLSADSDWSPVQTIIIPEAGTTGLSLFLYADGPDDGGALTVTQYRDVRVAPAEPMWEGVLAYEPPRAEAFALDRGRISVDSTTTLPDNLLGRFSGVADCNPFDDRTLAEVGIRAEMLQGAGRGIRLTARDHRACVSAPVRHLPSGAPVTIRFEYRRLEGRPPRFCLWQEGPAQCARLPQPPTPDVGRWHTYEATARTDAAAHGLRLFLYADGDGGEETTIEYRTVGVEPAAQSTVLLLPRGPGARVPDVAARAVHPSRIEIDIRDARGDFVLVVPESFSKAWSLSGLPAEAAAVEIEANGYSNAWLVQGLRGDAKVVAEYERARWPLLGLVVSALAGGATLVVTISARARRARQGRRLFARGSSIESSRDDDEAAGEEPSSQQPSQTPLDPSQDGEPPASGRGTVDPEREPASGHHRFNG